MPRARPPGLAAAATRRQALALPALSAASAVVTLALPLRARADEELPERKIGLTVAPHALHVWVGLQDLFTPASRERLTSGFATRVLVRAELFRHGDTETLAVAYQRAEIVYDIWDEKFRVRITSGAGTEHELTVASAGQAIFAGTALVHFPVELPGPLQPGERYNLAFRGDLNPLSPELVGEVRRWLRQPSGAQRRPGVGGGDSFFGNFVTVFVNPQIEDSEKQVRFLSQAFEGPRP